jgi:protein involved in sex pheromone biosynthesis
MNQLPTNKLLLAAATALFLSGCASNNTQHEECSNKADAHKSEQHACKAGASCGAQHKPEIK